MVKLVSLEDESAPLREATSGHQLLASQLALTEVHRALARRAEEPFWAQRWKDIQLEVRFVELDRALLVRAGGLFPTSLRSLDAIHLATALMLPGLTAFVGYDARLQAAASAAGLTALSPGVPA